MAGVLRGDEVHLFQDPEGPEGDVLQVADGRGDDVKRADGRSPLKRVGNNLHLGDICPGQGNGHHVKAHRHVPARRFCFR